MNTLELKWQYRPWGSYMVIYSDLDTWTKILRINGGEALSLQYHEFRLEYWSPLQPGLVGLVNGARMSLEPGVRYDVPRRVIHRISNPTENAIEVLEVATGKPDELDIVRVNDKYGRT